MPQIEPIEHRKLNIFARGELLFVEQCRSGIIKFIFCDGLISSEPVLVSCDAPGSTLFAQAKGSFFTICSIQFQFQNVADVDCNICSMRFVGLPNQKAMPLQHSM